MRINKKWILIFLLPTIMLFLLVYGMPIATLVYTSFADWEIGSKIELSGINNYLDLFQDRDFKKASLNTAIWICLQATVNTLIGLVFALILARKPFYWKFGRIVYMIPNVISSAALGLLFLCFFNPSFGVLNGILSAITGTNIEHNWFMNSNTAFFTVTMTWLPFAAVGTILILAEHAAIPVEIFEAAKVDGAGEMQTIIHITLPALKNIIGTCAVLGGTYMLKTLDIILITTSGGPGNTTLNLPMFIYQTALRSNNFGLANTAGVLLIMIGACTVVVIRKVFRIGEVK